METKVSEADYKGNPMCVISTGPNDRFPFQFGLKKAQLIVKHIGEIRAFVMTHEQEKR